MLGAICGDIVGSRFERKSIKNKDFEFFGKGCDFTDDTVMTCAVAAALLNHLQNHTDLSLDATRYMQAYGRSFPTRHYGTSFAQWIGAKDPIPYNSWGNGAGMRVSPCGFLAKTLEEAKHYAKQVTQVTHNHPEGLKGAEAIATATFLAKVGYSKEEIRSYIDKHYYKLDFTLDEIRPTYDFNGSCQGSVPQAIECFLESIDFEDAIRNAISLGGDSDTLGAMAGAIAEAHYGIPDSIKQKILNEYLNDFLKRLVEAFYNNIQPST